MTKLYMIFLLGILVAASGCAHAAGSMPTTAPGSETALDKEQLLAIASAAEQLGDTLRAQQYLLAARHAGADESLILPRLFRLYVADGQYRLAIDVAQEQLRSHPRQVELRLLLAGLYEATDLVAQSIEEYQRVLALRADEPRAHFLLATILHDQGGDPQGADRHFRAYLASAPNGAHAEAARAQLLKELP